MIWLLKAIVCAVLYLGALYCFGEMSALEAAGHMGAAKTYFFSTASLTSLLAAVAWGWEV